MAILTIQDLPEETDRDEVFGKRKEVNMKAEEKAPAETVPEEKS